MPLVALSPALAPLVGAWLLQHAGWRAIFSALLVITMLLLISTLLIKNSYREIDSINIDNNISLLKLIKSPVFSGNVLVFASCSSGFFAWLTGSPFILKDMGYTPNTIGLSYIPQTLAFLLGGYGCRSALNHIKRNLLLPALLVLYCISIISLYLVATLSAPTLTKILIPFCCVALINGAIYPITVANALTPFPGVAGKAVALQNTLQLFFCFISSMLVSIFIAQPLLATVTTMLSTIILVVLGAGLTRYKHNTST